MPKKFATAFIKPVLTLSLGIILGVGLIKAANYILQEPPVIEGDYRFLLTEANAPIVVYGTSWCPYCKQARDLLKSHNITFLDLDIEASEQALKQYKQLGGDGVPVIVFKDALIQGFHKKILIDKITQLKTTN